MHEQHVQLHSHLSNCRTADQTGRGNRGRLSENAEDLLRRMSIMYQTLGYGQNGWARNHKLGRRSCSRARDQTSWPAGPPGQIVFYASTSWLQWRMADCTIQEFLIDSARYGDTEDVETALKEGAKVDSTDDGGRTGAPPPLFLWARRMDCDAAPGLRRDDGAADILAAAPAQWPRLPSQSCGHASMYAALHMACANGHLDIVRLLLGAQGVRVSSGHASPHRGPSACPLRPTSPTARVGFLTICPPPLFGTGPGMVEP